MSPSGMLVLVVVCAVVLPAPWPGAKRNRLGSALYTRQRQLGRTGMQDVRCAVLLTGISTSTNVPLSCCLRPWRERSVSSKVYTQLRVISYLCTPRETCETHVGINPTDRNGEHSIKVCVWPLGKSDQVSEGENTSEQSCLHGTANELVDDRVCVSEACFGTSKEVAEGAWSKEGSDEFSELLRAQVLVPHVPVTKTSTVTCMTSQAVTRFVRESSWAELGCRLSG